MNNRILLKNYLILSKSRIVFLVGLTAIFGYLIGFHPENKWNTIHFILSILGTCLTAAGGSALNQYQERHIDAKMDRTKDRPLVSGAISESHALLFIFTCLGLGLGTLYFVEIRAFYLGILAFISYNGLYTLFWKQKWAFAAVPGALPGALPVWMGYLSAHPDFLDPMGVFLFLILFYWQMPHFWVLAYRYQHDYALGQIPTLPVSKGHETTMKHIFLWLLGYIALMLGGPSFLRLGTIYILSALFTGAWLFVGWKNYSKDPNDRSWIRFFLAINFSLLLIYGAILLDLWSAPWIVHLSNIPHWW